VFSCGTIGNGGGNNNDEADDVLPGLPTGAIAAAFVSINRETVLLLILLFVVAICCRCFGVAAASVPAVGFVVVVCCGVVAVDDTAVVFAADAAFDKSGFNVFGMPHIFDSVVLTGSSFDSGLLGSHIAAICSVDNIVLLPSDSAGDGDDGWVVDADSGDDGEDECCA
jgi:hypothetical protein